MTNDALREHWISIGKAIAYVIKQANRLPVCEQDQEFADWLNNAFYHAESRETALTDLS